MSNLQKRIPYMVFIVVVLSLLIGYAKPANAQSSSSPHKVAYADWAMTKSCKINTGVASINASVVVSTNGNKFTGVRGSWSWWSGYTVTANWVNNGATAWLDNSQTIHLYAWGTVNYGLPSPWGVISIVNQTVRFHCIWTTGGVFRSWRG